MKKALAIILALCMILSFAALAACTDGSTDTNTQTETDTNTNTDTQTNTDTNTEPDAQNTDTQPEGETEAEKMERLQNSKPNEYVMEKLDAGMEVLVCFMPPEMGATTMVDVDNGFREKFEGIGCTYVNLPFNMDTAQQITQIENYVTMGATEIITVAFDSTIADAAKAAMEAGTIFALWAGVPTPGAFSLCSTRDFVAIGAKIGDMMVAWAEEQGGVVKTALLTNSANEAYVAQNAAMLEVLEASDAVDIAFTAEVMEMTVDSGFTFAQDALTYDSGIRMFLGFTAGQALGMNNAIVSMQPDKLAEFGVFAADWDSTSLDLLAQGENNESAFRGYAACGYDDLSQLTFELSVQFFNGEYEEGTPTNEPIYVNTNFDYKYDERT